MSLYEFAKSELDRIKKDEEGMQEMMNHDILEIVKMFGEQGHSGFTAGYALNILEKLLRFKPITPLTGEKSEWKELSNGVFENKRCSSVFKVRGGICYDNDAIIVSDDGGISWFQSNCFRKEVTFPYRPPVHAERVYIEYTNELTPGFSSGEYEVITDKPDRIKALYERKRKEFDAAQEA